MSGWRDRHRISMQSEKRVSQKSIEVVLQETQKFHTFCHSVMANPILGVADEDVYNCDEVPNSTTGHMRPNLVSLNYVGVAKGPQVTVHSPRL